MNSDLFHQSDVRPKATLRTPTAGIMLTPAGNVSNLVCLYHDARGFDRLSGWFNTHRAVATVADAGIGGVRSKSPGSQCPAT